MPTATKLWTLKFEIPKFETHSFVAVGMGFPTQYQHELYHVKIWLLMDILELNYEFEKIKCLLQWMQNLKAILPSVITKYN